VATNAARVLALVIALVAMGGEALRSWGVSRPWYAVADDFLVGMLLLAGAARATKPDGPALLAGGFGLACGIFYGSFCMHVAALGRGEADPGNFSQSLLTCAIGALLAGGAAGLALAVRGAITGTER
jgi:hypothetical protein